MDATHPDILDTRLRPMQVTMRNPDGSPSVGWWGKAPCSYCGSTEQLEWGLTRLAPAHFCSEQCAQWYIDEHVDESFPQDMISLSRE